MGINREPTLAVVVLSNKFWYMCGEIWVVVARTHYLKVWSFTYLSSIRPQVLARLSCSDGDAIQVGAIYANIVVV